MANMGKAVTTLLALSVAVCASPAPKEPTARVKNGTLVGTHSIAFNQDYFLGVPFAQPPVGDLRFRQAQSLNATWPGVREAKSYEKHCVGYGVSRCHVLSQERCVDHLARPNFLPGV
jgi:hypothetical protein